jgi:hypothetical protein
MTLQPEPYQQRMLDEQAQLEERLQKLQAFVNTQAFQQLEIEDRELLLLQLIAMRDYASVLGRRINVFMRQL